MKTLYYDNQLEYISEAAVCWLKLMIADSQQTHSRPP